MIATSVTSPSSTRLRLRALSPRIRQLGDRPLYELLCELVSLSSMAMDRVEAYAALTLHADLIAAYGGRDLPPAIFRIK
jgi:hypothetical protein